MQQITNHGYPVRHTLVGPYDFHLIRGVQEVKILIEVEGILYE